MYGTPAFLAAWLSFEVIVVTSLFLSGSVVRHQSKGDTVLAILQTGTLSNVLILNGINITASFSA